MIKKLLAFLLVLAIAGIAVIYFFGSSFISKQIKVGVEKFDPQVTQTSVQLDNVSLSILSGNGTLEGLYIGNPEGYKSEHIFALGKIDIDVDPGSVFSDKIIINHIHISKAEISYEKTLTSSNVKKLLKNIEEFTGAAEKAEEKQPEAEETGAAKQVVIKELIIEDTKAYAGIMGAGVTAVLPTIKMTDIGEEGSNTNVAEAINIILAEVLKAIGPAIAEAGKAGGDAAGGAGSSAVESIKGLFGN